MNFYKLPNQNRSESHLDKKKYLNKEGIIFRAATCVDYSYIPFKIVALNVLYMKG